MAHRKAGGSSKNLRDSQGQRLGVKLFGGQKVNAGQIIIRQNGTKWHPGQGVKKGRDDTLYAMTDGVVDFSKRKKKKFNQTMSWERVVSVLQK